MGQVLGIKFVDHGQVYFFDSGEVDAAKGDRVIVKTDQGRGLGEVVVVRGEGALPGAEGEEIKPIERVATADDLAKQDENDALAREAFRHCRERIAERKLEMKLVDVEVFFDRSKIIFYFTAPARVDFRELVKDLVKNYRTRIELRQIGVRHETQMIGAVGNCGMTCCCRRFLRKFAPVTIKMAKEQNLFLNPAKISGICGRLLCCLSYEHKNYEEFHRNCPRIGKRYATNIGLVKVIRANLFSQTLTLILEGGEEREVSVEEWQELEPQRPDPQQLQQQQQAPQRRDDGEGRGRGRAKTRDRGRGRRSGPGETSGKEGGAPGAGPGEGAEAKERKRPRKRKERAEAAPPGGEPAAKGEGAPQAEGEEEGIFLGKPKRPKKPARAKPRSGRKPRDAKPGEDGGAPPQAQAQPEAKAGAKAGAEEGDAKGRPRRKRKRKPRRKPPGGSGENKDS